MSNSLDPDQVGHFVGSDMGPNLFAKVISRQQNLSLAGKELNPGNSYNLLFLVNINHFTAKV